MVHIIFFYSGFSFGTSGTFFLFAFNTVSFLNTKETEKITRERKTVKETKYPLLRLLLNLFHLFADKLNRSAA